MTTGRTTAPARHRAVAAAGLLACLALAGCGSTAVAGIPAGASVKSFCAASATFARSTQFDQGVKAADKLRDTGTPKGIPADARHGFELVVDIVTKAKDKGDLEKRYTALTEKQKKSVAALDAYITKTC